MRYSIIVPVYNRPEECDELLESLLNQTVKDFEVIIVEDGSSVPCGEIVERYASRLNVRYFNKPNSGPGQTRNYGVARAVGDYVLILDSDVLVLNLAMRLVAPTARMRPSLRCRRPSTLR